MGLLDSTQNHNPKDRHIDPNPTLLPTTLLLATMGVLTIYLDKCTDISDTDMVSEGDPYITFDIEQDNIVSRVFILCGIINLSVSSLLWLTFLKSCNVLSGRRCRSWVAEIHHEERSEP
jgi:hypothetical protein